MMGSRDLMARSRLSGLLWCTGGLGCVSLGVDMGSSAESIGRVGDRADSGT